ncbi:MAG: HlyC/CorC family transporter [Chloroflexi bacterium AL-W]|nr:HlyC/CorC family transporter [Chloroflexi bacterium AL-N1]NOK70334.1 HlyC/CorC family transporter [Chloroflexi bacterium AL-N10]NOK78012.1 HlyC/CorC family transporter [Chloroflexi bacterium AL-N5]NOK85111.1 HlyC/CorC family transporter [Chloroflexi bacterium AL-W]
MFEGFLVEIVIILLLMLANGFFAASEIAVVSARRSRLEQQSESGNRGATSALQLAKNPNKFLSTVQVGITVIGTFAAAFGGASLAVGIEALFINTLLAPYASTISLAIVVVGISYFSLIIGELVPKRLALQNAEGIASTVAPIMDRIAKLVGPVVSFLTFSTELVLRLLGRHRVAETPVTEEDILALVREGAASGTVEKAEQDFISSVFTFTDRSVRSLITPRLQIVALDIGTPTEKAVQKAIESGYSRLPVYDETLDNIVGVLFVKDLLQAWGRPEEVDLQSILKPPVFVLENQRAAAVLQQLKHQRVAMALVLDEYGQIEGLVTLEDILEELVGDLPEESERPDEEQVVRREDGSYLVDGLISITDLIEYIDLPNAEDLARKHGFDTIAGLLLFQLGYVPQTGERLTWQDYLFEVVDMDGKRIDKILIAHVQNLERAQTEGLLAKRATKLPPNSQLPREQQNDRDNSKTSAE